MVLLSQRLGLNIQNSSIPPSKDSNRKKSSTIPGGKKVGAQMGHIGMTLASVD
jgi:transposase